MEILQVGLGLGDDTRCVSYGERVHNSRRR